MIKGVGLFFLFFSINSVYSQVTDSIQADTAKIWDFNGSGNVNFSQVQVSENWAKGGENSLSLLTDLGLFLTYTKNKHFFKNSLFLEYGTFKSASFSSFRKNSDRLEFVSNLGRKISKVWYYSLLASYQSQIVKGYEYPGVDTIPPNLISSFNSPGYFVLSIGMDYKPSDMLTVHISPLTSKTTFVTDERVDETNYGLDENKKIKEEIGAYLNAYYLLNIYKNITWENKINFFTNYLSHPERVDVDWQSKLFFKINKYFSTTISTHLIYDYDIVFENEENGEDEPKVQFKQMMSLGFSYKF
ncbi:MAG: DUF3078 domain-containing protein [bacterium]